MEPEKQQQSLDKNKSVQADVASAQSYGTGQKHQTNVPNTPRQSGIINLAYGGEAPLQPNQNSGLSRPLNSQNIVHRRSITKNTQKQQISTSIVCPMNNQLINPSRTSSLHQKSGMQNSQGAPLGLIPYDTSRSRGPPAQYQNNKNGMNLEAGQLNSMLADSKSVGQHTLMLNQDNLQKNDRNDSRMIQSGKCHSYISGSESGQGNQLYGTLKTPASQTNIKDQSEDHHHQVHGNLLAVNTSKFQSNKKGSPYKQSKDGKKPLPGFIYNRPSDDSKDIFPSLAHAHDNSREQISSNSPTHDTKPANPLVAQAESLKGLNIRFKPVKQADLSQVTDHMLYSHSNIGEARTVSHNSLIRNSGEFSQRLTKHSNIDANKQGIYSMGWMRGNKFARKNLMNQINRQQRAKQDRDNSNAKSFSSKEHLSIQNFSPSRLKSQHNLHKSFAAWAPAESHYLQFPPSSKANTQPITDIKITKSNVFQSSLQNGIGNNSSEDLVNFNQIVPINQTVSSGYLPQRKAKVHTDRDKTHMNTQKNKYMSQVLLKSSPNKSQYQAPPQTVHSTQHGSLVNETTITLEQESQKGMDEKPILKQNLIVKTGMCVAKVILNDPQTNLTRGTTNMTPNQQLEKARINKYSVSVSKKQDLFKMNKDLDQNHSNSLKGTQKFFNAGSTLAMTKAERMAHVHDRFLNQGSNTRINASSISALQSNAHKDLTKKSMMQNSPNSKQSPKHIVRDDKSQESLIDSKSRVSNERKGQDQDNHRKANVSKININGPNVFGLTKENPQLPQYRGFMQERFNRRKLQ